ncbi:MULTISPECIES: hypothetical protein [unclassified Paraburkholderia]|nr:MULTISPECIES: hypothetical protein [unclassified Paraburkholderia]MBB5447675.1 hypothetical protein [Paraburkholderia sp. WSM4177]MBB5488149.1 hypothetical protein [Paraburkholderia sp. WSM4180]
MHMTNVVQHQLPGESTQFVNLVRKWDDLTMRFADALRGRSG